MAMQLKTFPKITISKSQVTNITVLIHPIRPGVQHISDPTFDDITPTTHQKNIDNIRSTPPLTNKASNLSAEWAKDKDKAAATFLTEYKMIIGIVSTSSQEAVKLKTIRWPSLSLVL